MIFRNRATKAQGALGAIFPVKKTAKKIDWEKLFEYSGTLKTSDEKEEDDDEVIERTAKSAEKNTKKPTQWQRTRSVRVSEGGRNPPNYFNDVM